MKKFFSKYQDFVTGIKLYDNNKNEFTLKKDESDEWLEQHLYFMFRLRYSTWKNWYRKTGGLIITCR